MAPKFQIDAKTFLSFKTCKYNYFLKFLQDCLNFANYCSSFKNFFFPKNSNWSKNSIWQNFCTKIHDFERIVLIFGYVILIVLFYCKKFVASPEKSKWRLISRWRRKCFNIFKNDIFVHFSFVFFIFWVKIKRLWKNFFLKIQNGVII
jgi:hypothetical protein